MAKAIGTVSEKAPVLLAMAVPMRPASKYTKTEAPGAAVPLMVGVATFKVLPATGAAMEGTGTMHALDTHVAPVGQ